MRVCVEMEIQVSVDETLSLKLACGVLRGGGGSNVRLDVANYRQSHGANAPRLTGHIEEPR